MKKTIALFLFCLVAVLAQAQTEPRHEVELVTDSGTIRLVLYNETPRHRDNFLKQVQSGAYNGVLFHRVIKDFMVQTGDLASKTAKPGQQLGDTPEAYSIPAEICFPKLCRTRRRQCKSRKGVVVHPVLYCLGAEVYRQAIGMGARKNGQVHRRKGKTDARTYRNLQNAGWYATSRWVVHRIWRSG